MLGLHDSMVKEARTLFLVGMKDAFHECDHLQQKVPQVGFPQKAGSITAHPSIDIFICRRRFVGNVFVRPAFDPSRTLPLPGIQRLLYSHLSSLKLSKALFINSPDNANITEPFIQRMFVKG